MPRSIKNTYIFLPDDSPDLGMGIVAGGASSEVSGAWPSMCSAPFGAMYMLYHSVRHRSLPITPPKAQPTPLAFARQQSSILARAIVRAAGDPCVSVGADAMYKEARPSVRVHQLPSPTYHGALPCFPHPRRILLDHLHAAPSG